MVAKMKYVVFGGGGQVAQHFAKIAIKNGHQVISVVRDDSHNQELEKIGATPALLSLESASVTDLTHLLKSNSADAVLFAAGAGGKGDPGRTRKVDYEGAVKVYDAMEAGNVKRLVVVGAVDIRDRSKGYPEWYNEDDKQMSDRMYNAIRAYYEAKYDAEVELHKRKALKFTVIRPGGLTLEAANGAQVGRTHLKSTSRELVGQACYEAFQSPETEGSTLDVIDGDQEIGEAMREAVEKGLDSWVG